MTLLFLLSGLKFFLFQIFWKVLNIAVLCVVLIKSHIWEEQKNKKCARERRIPRVFPLPSLQLWRKKGGITNRGENCPHPLSLPPPSLLDINALLLTRHLHAVDFNSSTIANSNSRPSVWKKAKQQTMLDKWYKFLLIYSILWSMEFMW